MIDKSKRLDEVKYEIRGPVFEMARQMEAAGKTITRLNIGNTGPFGYALPGYITDALSENLEKAQGYADTRGLTAARKSILAQARDRGIRVTSPDNVIMGNGVSELIQMVLAALLNEGDEVLLPTPDYPLWTAATTLSSGVPVHYLCDSENGWQPVLADIEAKITPRTRALVLINPNNPTGAVYSPEVLKSVVEIAGRHGLLLFSDEIYDSILFEGAKHYSTASFTGEYPCITFGGMSKNFMMPGFRCGWMIISGNTDPLADFIEGITKLAGMRLCANVLPQYAVPVALSQPSPMVAMSQPGGRLERQRRICLDFIENTEGLSSVLPKGAFYMFPKIDLQAFGYADDFELAIDMLQTTSVLIVQGTGFNWTGEAHFRIAFLPEADELEAALSKVKARLDSRREAIAAGIPVLSEVLIA
ncbi:MAG: aminotransferase class I/II-fold pyridoxal phosphate-dependent enzyme [Bacteroidota bacterium]